MEEIFGDAQAPPLIKGSICPTEVDFHPSRNVIAVGWIGGAVECYELNKNESKMVKRFDHHKESCRSVKFSSNGDNLFTASADHSLSVIDVTTQTLKYQAKDAHESGIYCIDSKGYLLASGDDDGLVKVWDLRQKDAVHKYEREDFISSISFVGSNAFWLIFTSGDSTLSYVKHGKVIGHSEYCDEELLSSTVVKEGKLVACGSQSGTIMMWNWGEWRLPVCKLKNHPQCIQAMITLDDNRIITGSEDGIIRLVSILPNEIIGPVGTHTGGFPIEDIAMSYDKSILASTSHNNCVNFTNISHLFKITETSIDEADTDMQEDEAQPKNNFFAGLA